MTDRVIDISESAARLSADLECLAIGLEGAESVRVPFREIAAVVLADRRITVTRAALSGLAEAGCAVVICDDRFVPCAMMLPLAGHFTQSERFAAQAAASLPVKKRLWRDIVRAKLRAQARLLERLRGSDFGLRDMAASVRSGDPENMEAQASRRYWTALFDDPDFSRDRDRPGRNALLNYGYAVLRAAVARAVCASGLHPSLGIHHHNRYDAFPLADDLMEPFRPLVDAAVVSIVASRGRGPDADAVVLDKDTRAALLEILTSRYEWGGEARTLFDWSSRTASSLARVFLGLSEKMDIPEL
ncbi:MAG: type II CRISPR-associated endonuclease Cas1 [Planctomycetota bacterium]|nr:type II CRISPR-associated endonuclease Cas1 [Planctomycetota bacterium]